MANSRYNVTIEAVFAVTGLASLTSAVAEGTRAWINYSAKLENARIAFTTMIGSATEAEAHLKELERFARTTPFEFGDLLDASARMRALGFATKEVIPLLRDVGNVTAASGEISQDRLQRIIKALSDVRSRGALYTQEIKQFAEAGIPAYAILEKQFGKSRAELLKMVESGQVTSEIFFEAFQKFSQQNFGGLMEKQSRTFVGAMSNIKDSILITANTSFDPLFRRLTELGVRLASEIDGAPFEEAMRKVIAAGFEGAGALTGGLVTGLVNQITDQLLAEARGKEDFGSRFFEGLFGLERGEDVLGAYLRRALTGARREAGVSLSSSFGLGNLLALGGAQGGVQGAETAERQRVIAQENIKLQEKLRNTVADLSRQIQFFGDTSAVAATKQKLLAAGVTDLNSGLAAQAIVLARALDQMRRAAELAEAERTRIFNLEQDVSRQLQDLSERARVVGFEIEAASRGGLTELEKFNIGLAQAALTAKRTVESLAPYAQAAATIDLGDFLKEAEGRFAGVRKEVEGASGELSRFNELWLRLINAGGLGPKSQKLLAPLVANIRGRLAEIDEGTSIAERAKKLKAFGDAAQEAATNINRDLMRALRDLDLEARGLELRPIEQIHQQLEDVKGFRFAPGALDPFFAFVAKMEEFNERRVAEKFLEFLPKDLERRGEIARTVAESIGRAIDATNQATPLQRERNALEKEWVALQQEVGVAAETAAARYRNEWLRATNEVALADDKARLSMIRSQARLADQTIYHSGQANAALLEFLASQRSLTEVIADAKIGVIQSTFDVIDSGLERITSKLGLVGNVLKDLISGFVRLALNRAFQMMLGAPAQGPAFAGAGGGGFSGLLGGVFGGGQAGGFFGGGTSPFVPSGGGALSQLTTLFGGGIGVPSSSTTSQPLGGLAGAAASLSRGAAGRFSLSGLGASAAPILPLLGATFGAQLGRGGFGSILGGAGGLLLGGAGLAALAPGLFGVVPGAVTVAGSTSASLAAGAYAFLTNPFTIGIGAALLVGGLIYGRNAARRRDEQARDQLHRDARTQLYDILRQVQTDRLDGAAGVSQALAVLENYRQQASQLRDSKTRRIALESVSHLNPVVEQIRQAADKQAARREWEGRFTPTFARGGVVPELVKIKVQAGEHFMPPHLQDSLRRHGGVIPGVNRGYDDTYMYASPGTVITPRRPQSFAYGGTVEGFGPNGGGRPVPLHITLNAQVVIGQGDATRIFVTGGRTSDGRDVIVDGVRHDYRTNREDGLIGEQRRAERQG